MSRPHPRRYRKASDRRVWVFSELNRELRPEQIAKILAATALQAMRREHAELPDSGAPEADEPNVRQDVVDPEESGDA